MKRVNNPKKHKLYGNELFLIEEYVLILNLIFEKYG